jgi:hypothetical protein
VVGRRLFAQIQDRRQMLTVADPTRRDSVHLGGVAWGGPAHELAVSSVGGVVAVVSPGSCGAGCCQAA